MINSKLNRFEKLRYYISEIEGKFISARGLSRLLGVSPTLIGSIERGNIPPSLKVAAKLKEKYGISKEWFLTGEGIAPWEERDYQEWFDQVGEIEKQIKKGERKPKDDKILAGFAALSLLLKTPQKRLVDYFIEAGKNPEFRKLLYNILTSGLVENFEGLKRANQRIKELESRLADAMKKTR